jgi:hypothetical protein
VTSPERESVGVLSRVSEKAAVMVTLADIGIKLSASVSVRITVGPDVSKVKVMLSVPTTYELPARSVPDTVAA